MGRIADSLKDNLEHILKAVPEEHRDDAKKAIEGAEEIVKNTAEEELELIKKELNDNADVVDTEAAIADLDKNPTAHQPPPPPTEEEQKAAQEEELKNVTKEPN